MINVLIIEKLFLFQWPIKWVVLNLQLSLKLLNLWKKKNGMNHLLKCLIVFGQKIKLSWKADGAYTNRYIMRTLNATLDDGGTYSLYTPALIGMSGEETYTVTTAGNILFAGYSIGFQNTCLIGEYVKIKIENPT